jgi:cytochrome c2
VSTEAPHEGGHKKPPIPTPAKKVPAMNIEKRSDRLYEAVRLHKWFAISSLLLFIFTMWMVWADYARQWKTYQRTFNRMQIEKTQQDIAAAANTFDRAKFNQLEQQVKQSQAEMRQHEANVDAAQKKIDDIKAQAYRANQNAQFEKALYDAQKYEYDEAVAHKASNAASLKTKLDAREKELNEYKLQVDQLTLDQRAAESDLNKYAGARDAAQKGIDALTLDYNRLLARKNSLNPGLIVTSFRNAPILDMLNASEKVQQSILSNLYNDHPFKQITRVDRCKTCHMGIDVKGFENAPQPFTTHSNLDLYVGSGSPHPMENFGCTSCHSGLDRAVDFNTAGHSPRDEKQSEEWKKKYDWHEQEFLETPMLPMQQVEAGCYKCHNSSNEVPKAAALGAGRDLIRIYGCFGCHKIPGYDNIRKVGPDLSTVSGKLTKDWVRKWLSNPKEFKSEARMPQFWWNSNNSGPEFDKRNVAEINAISDYLFANSKPKELPPGRTNGDEAKGKEIVASVGCFGCHVDGPIQENPRQSQIRRKHGYSLQAVGSKLTPNWVYNWVKDPQQVWPETKMPSLRLMDDEAANVTAYLTSMKNPDFDKKPWPETDPATLDTIVLQLLRNNSTEFEARDKLKAMSQQEKTLFAGQRLIAQYGCFGCHNIPQFENAQPIGTELSTAGTKPISQLDFGFVNIEHSRHAWYEQKLKDPRIFDVGRVKRPEELLRMPNFHFKDSEVNSIAMVLSSMVKDKVAMEMRDNPSDAIIAGRNLIAEKNCRGCHIIEGMGGDVRALFTATNVALAPPNLNTEGFKTQPLWLHPFLIDPGKTKLRPWLTFRMPTFHFSETEAATIGAYFAAVDRAAGLAAPYPFMSTDVQTTPERLKIGSELFQKSSCTSCHPTSNVLPPGKDPTDLAPNLMLAGERLRPDWVLLWLKDPQKVFPGTKMPTFFPGYPDTPYKDYPGDAPAQILAIRDHLFVDVAGGGKKSTSKTVTTNN